MAHLIDNSKGKDAFVSFEAPAWHGLGVVLHNPISARDALQQGGLDYEVIKLPNIHGLPDGNNGINYKVSEDSFFTFRTDVNAILGSKLGKDYNVMQNIEALNIVDKILDNGTASIETAGAIDEGRKVFICLRVKQDIIVNGNDTIKQYVLIATSHDGSMSITAMPTNIRVVCNNTLTAALRGCHDKIKIRHTANAQERLKEAAKVLNLIAQNTTANTENYNLMRSIVISKQEMWNYFGNVFCTPQEIKLMQDGGKPKDVISTKKQNILDGVFDAALTGQGHSLAMAGNDHTMWSAYNGITDFMTRRRFNGVNERANSMLFGGTAEVIERAGVLALNKSKIQPMHKTNFNFDLN